MLRIKTLREQPINGQWKKHRGATILPDELRRNRLKILEAKEIAPQGLAPKHEAAELLNDWENIGCPTNTGREGTIGEIQAAINRGPHKSALEPDAIANFVEKEVDTKVVKGQVRAVLWDDIMDNHPGQLTVSSVAAIPHKSRAYRSILYLSFVLRLEDGAS